MMHNLVQLLVAFAFAANVADARFYCHTCVSSSYRDCVWNPYTSLTKDCTEGDTTCATVILPNGHTYRGCSLDEECVTAGEDCVKCDPYSGCNIDRYPPDRLRCNICVSSHSPLCRALPYFRQFEKPCIRHVPGDRCVTVFDGFDVAYRDCLSAVLDADREKCAEPDNSLECVGCSMWHCNTAKVRADDRCLQCASNMTNCSNGKRPATSCSAPSRGRCFSRVVDQDLLQRGCLVDLSPEAQEECAKDPRNCAICEGDGCNASFLPEATLSCVQCDSRETVHCAQLQQNDSLVRHCQRHVNADRCYTRTATDGRLHRGCVSDLPEDSGCTVASPSKTCDMCSGNNCNRNVFPVNRLSCYQCDSAHNSLCAGEQKDYNPERALLCKLHQQEDGCYTKVYKEQVTRGCISDLGSSVCDILSNKECRTCYEANCNHEPGSTIRNNASAAVQENLTTLFLTFWISHVLLRCSKYCVSRL